MKYYCNRRTPKPIRTITNNDNKPSKDNPEKTADTSVFTDMGNDIILPPTDTSDDDAYDTDIEGQGGAYSQAGGFQKQTQTYNKTEVLPAPVYFDNMSGKFDLISVPRENNGIAVKSMTNFLDKYMGKYICLDLWTNECHRDEVCGTLMETGDNFIVINSYDTDKLTLIDLKAIRYINVFCR